MTPQFRLEKRQLADWQLIREIEPKLLRDSIDKLRSLRPLPCPPENLTQTLTSVLVNRDAEAESLLRQLLSLHGFARSVNLTTDQVFAGLQFGLTPAQSEWTEEQFQRWVKIGPLLRELFELDVVRLSAKALDLSYQHAELLQHAQILTDVRPVFDTNAREVRGAVISHSILLRYDDTEGDHTLSLSLDEADVRALKDQCERALTKSQTLQTHLNKQPGIAVWVPGKETDASL